MASSHPALHPQLQFAVAAHHRLGLVSPLVGQILDLARSQVSLGDQDRRGLTTTGSLVALPVI